MDGGRETPVIACMVTALASQSACNVSFKCAMENAQIGTQPLGAKHLIPFLMPFNHLQIDMP